MESARKLEQVLVESVDAVRYNLHTAMPGYVISYDRAKQRADVQLIVRGRKLNDDTDEIVFYRFPPLHRVPVRWPACSSGALIGDLAQGDVVMVHFVERSMAEWLEQGGDDVEPADPRRHDLSDAYIEPGLRPFPDAHGNNAYAAGAWVLSGDDVRLGSKDAREIAMADETNEIATKVRSFCQQLIAALNAAVVPQTPSGASSITFTAPLPSTPSFDDVASTKVKAE